MVKREGGGEGDARGVAVVEDDSQSAAPEGSWKRPDAVAGRVMSEHLVSSPLTLNQVSVRNMRCMLSSVMNVLISVLFSDC